MTTPAKLTDTALVLLSTAVTRPDHMVLPPPSGVRARGKALEKTLTKLLRLGLVEEYATGVPGQTWRQNADGPRVGLRITALGQEALGTVDASAIAANTAVPATGSRKPAAERTKRRPEQPTGRGSQAEPPRESRKPARDAKPGTKQAKLIRLLRRGRGASVAELQRQLGWQPHTVRAALTGLRKKGLEIARTKADRGATIYRIPASEVETDHAA